MDTSSIRHSLSSIQSASGLDSSPQGEVGELGTYRLVKRLLDILASLVLLILSSPFLFLSAVAVGWESRGPVIYKQLRVGRNGRSFVLFKIRTMLVDTPTMTTEDLKKSGKTYYTRSGLLLRRFSFDELPQLWNVLIGDMSLIGPRPSLATQEWLNSQRKYFRVLELRPGITGLAQVSGRDELSDSDKVAFDADYRSRCSFLLDFKIALMTVKAVFSGNGAN